MPDVRADPVTAVTLAQVREWARGLGLPVTRSGPLPPALLDRWDREHPDRPAPRPVVRGFYEPPAWTESAIARAQAAFQASKRSR